MHIEQYTFIFVAMLPLSLGLAAVVGYLFGTVVGWLVLRRSRKRRSAALPDQFFEGMTDTQQLRARRAYVEGLETGVFAGARWGFAASGCLGAVVSWVLYALLR
jgi:hypothetical protein